MFWDAKYKFSLYNNCPSQLTYLMGAHSPFASVPGISLIWSVSCLLNLRVSPNSCFPIFPQVTVDQNAYRAFWWFKYETSKRCIFISYPWGSVWFLMEIGSISKKGIKSNRFVINRENMIITDLSIGDLNNWTYTPDILDHCGNFPQHMLLLLNSKKIVCLKTR